MKRAKTRTKKAAPKRRAAPIMSAADGAADVRAYLRKLPAWQRVLAQRFDDLMARELPDVLRCIKWGIPFYGMEDNGWLVSCGGFPTCVKVTFFQGTKLRPVPPVGTSKQTRSLDVHDRAEFDAAPLSSWIRQAMKMPGFAS